MRNVKERREDREKERDCEKRGNDVTDAEMRN
jgi:hypothetical protein